MEVEKDTFTIVLAHEFFDALPINVFQVSSFPTTNVTQWHAEPVN